MDEQTSESITTTSSGDPASPNSTYNLDFEHHLSLGNQFNDQGQYKLAVPAYDKAIAAYNKHTNAPLQLAHAYKFRGLAHFLLDNYDQALADLTCSIDINPEDPVTYTILGDCFYDLAFDDQNTEETEAEYEDRILKYEEKALENYTKAIEIASQLEWKNTSNFYFKRGVALYELYDDGSENHNAANDFRIAIKKNPRFAQAYFYLAKSSVTADDNSIVIEYINQALEIEPGNTEYLEWRARYYFNNEKYTEVVTDCKMLRQLSGRLNPDFYQLQAEAHYAKKELDQAYESASIAVALNPLDEKAHFLLGQITVAQSKTNDAIYHYLQAYIACFSNNERTDHDKNAREQESYYPSGLLLQQLKQKSIGDVISIMSRLPKTKESALIIHAMNKATLIGKYFAEQYSLLALKDRFHQLNPEPVKAAIAKKFIFADRKDEKYKSKSMFFNIPEEICNRIIDMVAMPDEAESSVYSRGSIGKSSKAPGL